MGKKLEEYKNSNSDKIRIGSCIELFLLLNNFYTDFDKISDFLDNNEFLLTNQNKFTINEQLNDIKSVITNHIDILLNDIDKDLTFMDYLLNCY